MSQYLKGTQRYVIVKLKASNPYPLGTHFSSLEALFIKFLLYLFKGISFAYMQTYPSICMYIHVSVCIAIQILTNVYGVDIHTHVHTQACMHVYISHVCILTCMLKVSDSQSSHLMTILTVAKYACNSYTNQKGFSNLLPISKTP